MKPINTTQSAGLSVTTPDKPVNRLRELPSVDEISNSPELIAFQTRLNPQYLNQIIRNILDDERQQLLADNTVVISRRDILHKIILDIQRYIQPSMQPVINLSGTLIHTNLGRSLLPENAISALISAAASPVNLEYDLIKGTRGERDSHLTGLMNLLTGAETSTFVNNNAAAVLLTLNSLANRKEVIVSRGELIEIGGSFRLPDIMKKSGCKLVEVGTTNRTHAKDYINAITPKTALILKAHTSNYQINGFVKAVDIRELVQIGKENQIPVVFDLGSGALIDYAPFGLPKETTVAECIALGVDVVLFSGDKLLGGPQTGIIAGKHDLLQKINHNPMKRTMRLDKLRIALLEAIFRIYLQPADYLQEIPLIRWLKRPIAEIESIAQQAARLYQDQWGHLFKTEVQYDYSEVGSGSLPEAKLETVVLALSPYQWNLQKIAIRFRENHPPIIGRIHQNKFLLDMRTVYDVHLILPNFGDPA